mmetsp:Transcript_27158/g.68505  ORF Transcript_27158/g.68505 Transcript_27158/m.68505 type:complete len:254 (+) Transcript_27158:515-1276(+)
MDFLQRRRWSHTGGSARIFGSCNFSAAAVFPPAGRGRGGRARAEDGEAEPCGQRPRGSDDDEQQRPQFPGCWTASAGVIAAGGSSESSGGAARSRAAGSSGTQPARVCAYATGNGDGTRPLRRAPAAVEPKSRHLPQTKKQTRTTKQFLVAHSIFIFAQGGVVVGLFGGAPPACAALLQGWAACGAGGRSAVGSCTTAPPGGLHLLHRTGDRDCRREVPDKKEEILVHCKEPGDERIVAADREPFIGPVPGVG